MASTRILKQVLDLAEHGLFLHQVVELEIGVSGWRQCRTGWLVVTAAVAGAEAAVGVGQPIVLVTIFNRYEGLALPNKVVRLEEIENVVRCCHLELAEVVVVHFNSWLAFILAL